MSAETNHPPGKKEPGNSQQAQKIEIMDTTLRDGEQTQGVSYAKAEKLNIARMLISQVQIDRLEVCSAWVSHQELNTLQEICQWAESKDRLDSIEVLGYVDHKRSIDWILKAGGRVLNLLTKGSRKHCETQLRKSLQQHIEDIGLTLDYAAEKGVQVNVYLEDWSNGIQDSPGYVFELTEFLVSRGVSRIMLPDTLGVFSPLQVREYVGQMTARFPQMHFDFHPHNDYGLATANALEAVAVGVSGIHVTVNCLGERAGNVDLAQVSAVLRDKAGLELQIDDTALTNASRMVEVFSGKRISPNAPIVGKDVFTHTAGIHADGDKKGDLYSNDLAPDRFGRSRIYALGKLSGKASIEQNLKQLGMELSAENQKKVLERIVSLADEKKNITADDLPFIIADVLEGKVKWAVRIVDLKLLSSLEGKRSAEVTLLYHDSTYTREGKGDGAYDAFMNALALISEEAGFDMPDLVDYEVHIPPGGRTSALVETTITWQSRGRRFRTTGLDCDQNIAAVRATERALNMLSDRNFRFLKKNQAGVLP